MLSKQVQCIGTDPGLVHHGICRLAFFGFAMIKDDDGGWTKMPQFKILNWELWDLKRTLSYHAHPTNHTIVRNKYNALNDNKACDDILHMCGNVSHFVSSKEWLFETYRSPLHDDGGSDVLPPLVTELQCGQIKNHEWDVFLVSHVLPWCVKTVDHTKGLHDREILSRARKYGMMNDGELTYNERKAKSEEITRALLKMAKMQYWINFLNGAGAARRRDIPGKTPQVHDLCDAFLLALQSAIQMYEELEKNNKGPSLSPPYSSLIPPTPNTAITLFDSCSSEEEQEDEEEKAAPQRLLSLRQRANLVHESFVEHDENKKKRKRAPSIPKKKTVPAKKQQKTKKTSSSKKKKTAKKEEEEEEEVVVVVEEEDASYSPGDSSYTLSVDEIEYEDSQGSPIVSPAKYRQLQFV